MNAGTWRRGALSLLVGSSIVERQGSADLLLPAVTAMSDGVREPVGWFRYEVAGDEWTWSPGLFEIHGFSPGEIVPTSAVFAVP